MPPSPPSDRGDPAPSPKHQALPAASPAAPASPPGPSTRSALLVYVILSVLLTWPLAVRLGDRLPAGNNDLWQNVWNLWWWRTCILEGPRCPYETDLFFAPDGASLAFHTHSEANILLTLPVLLGAGEVAALNVATLLGFVLAALGGYLLARELLGDRRAALLAGAVVAFFPQHYEQSLEHINLASYGGMPLFLWALVRASRRGGAGRWAVCSLLFTLNALFSWHNGILILPGALILFGWELATCRRGRGRLLLEATGSGALAVALCLPFAWPMVAEILDGATYHQKPPMHKPIDLLFLLVPAEHHPLWGPLVEPLYSRMQRYPSAGFTGYLGIVPLGLAAVCLLRSGRPRREMLPWAVIAIAYVALSLGRELRVVGADTGVPMPFAIVGELPLLSTTRLANRFIVPAMCALAVLAGCGALRLLERSRRPGRLAFAILALVVVDYLWLPYPLRTVPRPDWVDHVTEAPSGALLNIPGGYRARAAEDLLHQTRHHRPLVGGYVSCTPPIVERRLDDHPFLRSIFEGKPDRIVPARPGLERLLSDLPIGVVALHLDRDSERIARRRRELRGTPEARLHNPARGVPRKRLEEIRRELRRLWGPPYWSSDGVELYGRPPPE